MNCETHKLRQHRRKLLLVQPRIWRGLVRHERIRQRLELNQLAFEARDPLPQLPGFLHALLVVGRLDQAVAVLHARKHRLHREVIRLRNRIELVIVTPRAADGQAEKRAAGRCHHVIQFVSALLARQNYVGTLHLVVCAAHEKTRRRIFAEQIARELFPDELVVRLVLVERANDVIAIRPGVVARRVHLEARRLGEPHHVQPVPRPPLAVARRRQQPLHQSLVSVQTFVRQKRAHFLRRRRQADQIKTQPANQRAPVRFRRGCELLRLQPRENERVNGIARRGEVFSIQ